MIRLLRLLRDHSDAVEADLSRYHQIDLLDLWRRPQRLSYRKLLVLVRFLPPDSATENVLRGGPAWTLSHDIADLHRRQALAVAGVKADHNHLHPAHPGAVKKVDGLTPDQTAARDRAKQRAADRQARLLGKPT